MHPVYKGHIVPVKPLSNRLIAKKHELSIMLFAKVVLYADTEIGLPSSSNSTLVSGRLKSIAPRLRLLSFNIYARFFIRVS